MADAAADAHARWDREALAAALAGNRFGDPLLVVGETESTNDLAWAEARKGAPDGLLVVAETQTRGRGRSGAPWHSPPGGGIWASFLLRPQLAERTTLIPLAAAVALGDAAEHAGVRAGLKWPNDLVTITGATRKLGGVLVESRSEPGGRWTLVAGFGLNVNARETDFPPALRGIATSLAIERGSDVDRAAVLAVLARSFAHAVRRIETGDGGALLDAWRARAALFGKPVRVRGAGAEVHGVAVDLAEDGALVIRLDSGAELTVRAGEVEVSWEPGVAHA